MKPDFLTRLFAGLALGCAGYVLSATPTRSEVQEPGWNITGPDPSAFLPLWLGLLFIALVVVSPWKTKVGWRRALSWTLTLVAVALGTVPSISVWIAKSDNVARYHYYYYAPEESMGVQVLPWLVASAFVAANLLAFWPVRKSPEDPSKVAAESAVEP